MAKENGENWVRYYRSDYYTCKVDTNSIKVREHNGRKYLEASIKYDRSKMLLALDIENQWYIILEGYNHVTGKKMNTHSSTFSGNPMYVNLINWVEKNRPEVINEIREHNKTAPPLPARTTVVSGPQSNTAVDSAPGVAPSATISTADIEYEILDSGAVKFKVRCPAKLSDDEDGFILYDETNNYIFTKPEKFKHHHGTYVTGWLSDDGIMYISNEALPNAFDYDPKTQSFTFYFWFGAGLVDGDNPNEDYYTNRMRLIDKNTVYNEHFSADSRVIGGFPRVTATNTYRYMTCDAIPLDKIVDETKREIKVHYRSDGTISSAWENYDANKCVWFGEHPEYFYREGNGRLNAMVDMMRAFLAVNGNIGESPYEVQYSDFGK